MAFVIPTFNLQADVFTWAFPISWVTPRITIDCQLRAPSMTLAAGPLVYPAGPPRMVLLMPAGTDIRDEWSTPGTHGDYLEVPAGSGRRYYCHIADDVGKGFPNEHRFAILIKVQSWPIPMP